MNDNTTSQIKSEIAFIQAEFDEYWEENKQEILKTHARRIAEKNL